MTAAPRPGWYPDPAGTHDQIPAGYRWWDGADWTDDTADTQRSPAPPAPRARPTPFRTAVALTLALTLFVGASVSVGLLLWKDPRATSDSTAPAAPVGGPTAADPPGGLDLNTRVVTIGRASMTLPADPYELTEDPRRVPGLFDVLFMANAAVHERYNTQGKGAQGKGAQGDGGSRTWSATVVLARLSASVGGAGLEVRGENAFHRISAAFFDGHPTVPGDIRWSDRTVSSCTGVLMTGRVGYAVEHLPSRYDIVTAQLVELPDGSVIIAVSSVPDDTDPAVAAQAGAALSSLAIG